ncbi:unnamed protein product, partial [Rotaria sp. Silwood1]
MSASTSVNQNQQAGQIPIDQQNQQ